MYGALTKQQTAQTNMEGRIASMDKWVSYYSSVADLGLKKNYSREIWLNC